ncbi:serine/arginine-rich SC35-like splicing factor SCL30A [Tanacetum coccineum]
MIGARISTTTFENEACWKKYTQKVAALDMNESILDADQVENLIKFCPTKEKMELLKINKRPSCEPRGFGFVQFVAEEAKYHMDIQILMGQQMTVLFAEENRKKPSDMRLRERRSGSRFSSDRRRSPPPRYSRSPCLPGPHLVAIPDHHLPAVITLLHPEEGTTQGKSILILQNIYSQF